MPKVRDTCDIARASLSKDDVEPRQLDVPGSVAKSAHAGIPWLLYLRNRVATCGPDLSCFFSRARFVNAQGAQTGIGRLRT
jgi:hypothetical protein